MNVNKNSILLQSDATPFLVWSSEFHPSLSFAQQLEIELIGTAFTGTADLPDMLRGAWDLPDSRSPKTLWIKDMSSELLLQVTFSVSGFWSTHNKNPLNHRSVVFNSSFLCVISSHALMTLLFSVWTREVPKYTKNLRRDTVGQWPPSTKTSADQRTMREVVRPVQ